MAMSLLFSSSIVIMIICDSRQAQLHRGDNDSVRDNKGYFPKERRKRVAKIISAAALIGARAVRKILKEARMIADSKDVMVYEKSGGYEQAFMDFRSLIQAGKLVKKGIRTSGRENVGKVGDRVVSLEPGDSHTQATLLITKPPADMTQRNSVDVIVYKK